MLGLCNLCIVMHVEKLDPIALNVCGLLEVSVELTWVPGALWYDTRQGYIKVCPINF
jgi:hypothetical protein